MTRSLPRRAHPTGALVLGAALLCAACAGPEVEVLAIANEGFLVRSPRRVVLVDALFRATAPYPQFLQQAPSEGLIQVMVTGGGAFERVDLVLVTHHHDDHFHAPTVAAFLARHPESVLVGTPEVAAALAQEPGAAEFAQRVVAPDLGWNQCAKQSPNGLELEVCKTRHSGGGDEANHIYAVTLDGFRLVHEGDAELTSEALASFGSGSGPDLAFLHDRYVFSPEARQIVESALRPRAIVLMHHRWAAADETRKRLAELPPEVKSTLPPVTVLGAETARARFRATTGKEGV